MKMIKKVPLVLSVILLISTITAFAKEMTLKVTAEGTNTTAVESNLYGTIDNSDLQVNVVKQIGEKTSIIYTGKLGEYEDGAWSNIDFSEIDFLLLFNLESSNNEALYIIPLEQPSNNLLNAATNENSTPSSNVTLTYNNDYYEGVLKLNNTLNVEIDVENVTKDLVCYTAEYDSTGRLIGLIRGAKIVVPTTDTSNGKFSVVATKTFTDSNAVNSKIMIWEDKTIRPVTNVIELSTQTCDYYADDISNAQLYDIGKKFYGKINSTDDVDYIKFQPSVSGEYTIGTSADMEITGVLYDEQGEILSECNSIANGYYIKEYLTAENTYYLKTTADEIGEYSIKFTIDNDNNTPNISAIDTGLLYLSDTEVDNTQLLLYTSTGTLLDTQNIAEGSNGHCVLSIGNTEDAPEYLIVKKVNNDIVDIYLVKLMENEQVFTVSQNESVSIPIITNNVNSFEDITFSIVYDGTKVEIADVSDLTKSIEVGTGLISSAMIDVLHLNENSVVFSSTKSVEQSWSGMVNSVKLTAKSDTQLIVKTIVCVTQ